MAKFRERRAERHTGGRTRARRPGSRGRAGARARPTALAVVPPPLRGRLWLNGRELGEPDPRFGHLSLSHD